MGRIFFGLLALCSLLSLVGLANAEDDFIGSVKNVSGDCRLLRDGAESKVAQGFKVKVGDTLRTGADGSVGVLFRDDSSLSLGPETEILLDEFVFDPAAEKMSQVTRVLKGTAAFLTGKIGKLSPKAVKAVTPNATIGIRGTHFLVKVSGG